MKNTRKSPSEITLKCDFRSGMGKCFILSCTIKRKAYLLIRKFFLYFFIRPLLSRRDKIPAFRLWIEALSGCRLASGGFRELRALVRGAPFRKERQANKNEIKKILVVRVDRIGDIIVSLPALEALKINFPQAKISILVNAKNSSLLKGFSCIDEIIVYEGFMSTLKNLRQNHFDLIADLFMDYRLKTAVFSYLTGAKFIAGFDIQGRGIFFNIRTRPDMREKKQISQYGLDLVKAIVRHFPGIYIPPVFNYPRLTIAQANKEYARFFLREKGIDQHDLILGVHPGGYYPSQRWPVDRFRQLLKAILKKYNTKILIFGSKEEESLIGQLLNSLEENTVKVVGYSLDKLAGIISLLTLFIGNNTGLLHLAAALNIPTVSTIGPTDAGLWYPGGGNNILLSKHLACSPCGRQACDLHQCMKSIQVEEVFKAVDKSLCPYPA